MWLRIRQIIMMICILTMRQRIVLLTSTANQFIRIKIRIILITVTVIHWVENHSTVAAGGGSLLICRLMAGYVLSVASARWAERWTWCRAISVDAVASLRLVGSFETLILSAPPIEILITVILIALFQTVDPFGIVCLQCLWTIIVHLSSLGHSRISCRKNTQSSILCCLGGSNILACFWP